ncbi:MAG: flavodoxin family protein [Candidatus Aureabacteria bacterium]|nr:flavodoxin family protein [Candidatus Auribacterota bacterium]
MNVLALVGTKRKKGLTASLCNKILEGAEESGHDTEIIFLYEHRIEFCTGCWACAKEGQCVINDDFAGLYSKVKAADVIILGTPCYWGNVTAVMKAFFDRHTGFAMYNPPGADNFHTLTTGGKIKTLLKEKSNFGPLPDLKGKGFIFVVTMTDPALLAYTSGDLRGTVNALKTYMHNLKGKLLGKLVFTDTLFRFLKNKQKKMLDKAYRLGRDLKVLGGKR